MTQACRTTPPYEGPWHWRNYLAYRPFQPVFLFFLLLVMGHPTAGARLHPPPFVAHLPATRAAAVRDGLTCEFKPAGTLPIAVPRDVEF